MHLHNIGGTEARSFQIVAFLASHFREATQEVTKYQLAASSGTEVIRESLATGEELAIDLPKLTVIPVGMPLAAGEREGFTVVFRFYRASDMRPFYKIVSFMRGRCESPPTGEYLYFPLALTPGSTVSGPNTPVYKKLRDELRKICVENLDLSIEPEKQ